MWIVLGLIWTLPWVCWPNRENPYWEPKAVWWLLGCSILLCRSLLSVHPQRPWRNPATAWVLLWIITTGILFFWLPYLNRRPQDQTIIYNVFIWVPTTLTLIGFLTVRILAGHYLTTVHAISQVTRALCLSAVLCAVYGLSQYAGWDQFFPWREGGQAHHGSEAMWAGMGNVGSLASLLAMTLPLCFFFQEKRYLLWLGLMGGTLLATQTPYASVAALGGLVIYGWLRLSVVKPFLAEWVAIGGLGLLLCTSAWWSRPVIQDERWLTWQETLYQRAQSHQWTGQGLESFRDRFQFGAKTLRPVFQERAAQHGLGSTSWHHPHNEFLKVFYDLGLIGLGLCTWMVGSTLARIWRYRQELTMCCFGASFIAWLLISLFHFPAHVAPTAWWGMLAWAVVEAHPLEGV